MSVDLEQRLAEAEKTARAGSPDQACRDLGATRRTLFASLRGGDERAMGPLTRVVGAQCALFLEMDDPARCLQAARWLLDLVPLGGDEMSRAVKAEGAPLFLACARGYAIQKDPGNARIHASAYLDLSAKRIQEAVLEVLRLYLATSWPERIDALPSARWVADRLGELMAQLDFNRAPKTFRRLFRALYDFHAHGDEETLRATVAHPPSPLSPQESALLEVLRAFSSNETRS